MCRFGITQKMLDKVAPPFHSLFDGHKMLRQESTYTSLNVIPELEQGLADPIARQVSHFATRMAHKQSPPPTTKIVRERYTNQQASA